MDFIIKYVHIQYIIHVHYKSIVYYKTNNVIHLIIKIANQKFTNNQCYTLFQDNIG